MSIYGHGSIQLNFGIGPFKTRTTVYGGPIIAAPDGMVSVNLREEAPEFGTIQFLIPDFSIPGLIHTVDFLERLVPTLIDRGEVYVGCAGGTGRTGLVLALLAACAGEPHPIAYVRANYKKHAVETRDQEKFIGYFPSNWIKDIRSDANRRGAKRFFTGFFR